LPRSCKPKRGTWLVLRRGGIDAGRPDHPARTGPDGSGRSRTRFPRSLRVRRRIHVAIASRGSGTGWGARPGASAEPLPRRRAGICSCRARALRRSRMNVPVHLTNCDREPIRIPGSIQPHGLLLVVDAGTGRVAHAAGDVEGRLGTTDWLGARLESLLGADVATAILAGETMLPRGVQPPGAAEAFDISVSPGTNAYLVELEPAGPAQLVAMLLPQLEAAAHAVDQAADMPSLMATAAREFRRLTGYDRVMVYRFLDDDAGKVDGEDAAQGQHSFLNHHFPASDIPAQARAVAARNLVRVIPDVRYRPAPLRPDRPAGEPLDMSDCGLRSVSPIHIQYLKNMGVAASASFSIVKDGILWG